MTREDYELIEVGLKEAEKDDTPFLVATEDELKVVGDANKTEVNDHDFEITFRLPPEKAGDSFRYVKKEFKNVYITPRQDSKVLKAITTMMPFFKAVRPSGRVEDLTDEEKQAVIDAIGDEANDAMYDMVALVLGIDEALKDYMFLPSVLQATEKIIRAFPETMNEADVFFG